MAKKAYFSPVLLTGVSGNGGIDITDSQEGAFGGGNTDFSEFLAWWNSEDVQENSDIIYENYPNFDPTDQTTYPAGFDLNDPDSWYILFG